MDNNTDKTSLKVIATYKELDYKGNVITKKISKNIPWTFNAEDFLKYAIRNGSYKGYPRPFTGYYNDLMKNYFGISSHDKIWRAVNVESEVVANVAKFVFQKRNCISQVMDWEDVK